MSELTFKSLLKTDVVGPKIICLLLTQDQVTSLIKINKLPPFKASGKFTITGIYTGYIRWFNTPNLEVYTDEIKHI